MGAGHLSGADGTAVWRSARCFCSFFSCSRYEKGLSAPVPRIDDGVDAPVGGGAASAPAPPGL